MAAQGYKGSAIIAAAVGAVALIDHSLGYTHFKRLQDADYALDDTFLQLEREATQYQKLLRMRHLAVLKQQLAEYGSTQEQSDYQSLLSCEEAPLSSSFKP